MPRNIDNTYDLPYKNLGDEGNYLIADQWLANLYDVEKEINNCIDTFGLAVLINNLVIDTTTGADGQVFNLAPAINPTDVCNYSQKPTTDTKEFELNFLPIGSIVKFTGDIAPPGFVSLELHSCGKELKNCLKIEDYIIRVI